MKLFNWNLLFVSIMIAGCGGSESSSQDSSSQSEPSIPSYKRYSPQFEAVLDNHFEVASYFYGSLYNAGWIYSDHYEANKNQSSLISGEYVTYQCKLFGSATIKVLDSLSDSYEFDRKSCSQLSGWIQDANYRTSVKEGFGIFPDEVNAVGQFTITSSNSSKGMDFSLSTMSVKVGESGKDKMSFNAIYGMSDTNNERARVISKDLVYYSNEIGKEKPISGSATVSSLGATWSVSIVQNGLEVTSPSLVTEFYQWSSFK